MKKIAILIFSLFLGVAGGISYSILSNEQLTAASTGNEKSPGWAKIKNGDLKNISIPYKDKVRLPKDLPFSPDAEFAEVVDFVVDEKKQLRTHYLNSKNKSSITISVVDTNVVPALFEDDDNLKLEDYVLENGTPVIYLDNGVMQFLYWNYEGLSYSIEAQKEFKNKEKIYTPKELIKIASSTFESDK